MYVSNAKKDTCLCLEFLAQAKQMVFISYLGSTCRIVLIATKSLIYKKKLWNVFLSYTFVWSAANQ